MSDVLAGILRRLNALETAYEQTRTKEVVTYTTGTWTPTLVGFTTPGSFTYDATNTGAAYTRIGNRVFFEGSITITAIVTPAAGALFVAGFPITPGSATYNNVGGAEIIAWSLNVPAGYTHVTGKFVNGFAALLLVRNGDNVAPTFYVDGGEVVLFGGTGYFQFSGSYRL